MEGHLTKISLGCLAVAMVLTAAACGSSNPAATVRAIETSSVTNSGAAIKLGIVEPFTGPQSETAAAEYAGAEVATNELNATGGVRGQKIRLVKENDQLSPTQDITDMRQLNGEGVKLTLGFQITPQCEAAAQTAQEDGQLVLGSHCTGTTSGPAVTNSDFWGLATPTGVLSLAMGQTLAQKVPNVRSWNVIGYDYDVGHQLWNSTRDEMQSSLGKKLNIRYQAFEPLSTVDFSSQVSALADALRGEAKPQALFLSTYGGATTSVLKEGEPYGIFKNLAATAQIGAYWGPAQSLDGTEPPVYNTYQYFWNCQSNAQNTSFVKQFHALTSHQPDTGAYQGYESVEMYAAAIAKAHSDSASAVAAALPGLSIESLTGMPMTMSGKTHLATQAVTTALLSGNKSSPDGIKVSDCVMKLSSSY
jgi:ABC-type branched-subunit amino acid transport system substrate-binding protein